MNSYLAYAHTPNVSRCLVCADTPSFVGDMLLIWCTCYAKCLAMLGVRAYTKF